MFFSQKAKQKWLTEGDRNTAFFQASVKALRIQAQLIKMNNDQGDWVTDPQLIAALGVQHFSSTFNSEQQIVNPSIVPDIIPRLVS